MSLQALRLHARKGESCCLQPQPKQVLVGACHLGVYMYVNQGGAVVLVQQHFASSQLAVQNWGLSMVQVLQQSSRGRQVVKCRCMPAGPCRMPSHMAMAKDKLQLAIQTVQGCSDTCLSAPQGSPS